MRPVLMHPHGPSSAAAALATLFVSLLVPAIGMNPARAEAARDALARGEDDLTVADFDSALETAERLLDSGDLGAADELGAWVLKARAELGLGRRSEAIESYRGALAIEPGWRLDPASSPVSECEALRVAREGGRPLARVRSGRARGVGSAAARESTAGEEGSGRRMRSLGIVVLIVGSVLLVASAA